MENKIHTSVMPDEVLQWLDPHEGDTYVDGTLGMGGHSLLVAEKIGPAGHLIGLDRDTEALKIAKDNLKDIKCRKTLLHYKYSEISDALKEAGVAKVDRILLDIGVSSLQLDKADRGFSFMRNGPLDMRMDSSKGITAQEIVMNYSPDELANIFYEFGEERYSKIIARRISEERTQKTINSTDMLAEIVSSAVKRRGRIHPATRVFQALRIAVNDELGELERGIHAACSVLNSGGRLALITFHSLEDRMAKRLFRGLAEEGVVHLPRKKVVKPAYAETRSNRRARSAKLRILEKL